MHMNDPMYAGLLRVDGSEPTAETGYVRVAVTGDDTVFPEAGGEGYALLCGHALFEGAVGGTPLCLFQRSKPIAAGAGTIPVIHKERLLVGVDVSERVGVRALTDAKEG